MERLPSLRSLLSHLKVEAFHVSKAGTTDDDYEDAFALNAAACRFAIADGATESSFASLWADLLVRWYTGRDSIDECMSREDLRILRRRWHQQIAWNDLAWYALDKARSGAFATLLGVSFLQDIQQTRWMCMARGDSCLFVVRNDCLVSAFPLDNSSAFDTSPHLIGSVQHVSEEQLGFLVAEGRCDVNDCFFMATDALACWILSEVESGCPPWRRLKRIRTEAGFRRMVERVRNRRTRPMKNDDTTLVRIYPFGWR